MTPSSYAVRFAAVCDRGLRRQSNQDRAWADVEHRVFVVCDGVGGSRGGEIASQTAIETVQDAFFTPDENPPLVRLERAVHYANRDIYEMAKHDLDLAGMATTIVAVSLDHETAYVAHAGDSRVYCLIDDELTQVTIDHSAVQDAVRHGELSVEEAVRMPKTNEITRALGVFPEVEVETQSFAFEPGIRFLLCTDGITRHVPNDELETLMRQFRDDPQGLCDHLHFLCYERGAEDNLTALVVCVDSLSAVLTPPDATLNGTATVSNEENTVRRGSSGRLSRTREISLAPQSFPPERATGEFHPLKEMVEKRRARSRRWLIVGSLTAVIVAVVAFWMGGVHFSTVENWFTGGTTVKPPTNADLYDAASRDFLEGNTPAARSKVELLVSREPKRGEYRVLFGQILLRERKYAEAVRELETATKDAPKLADAWLHLAAARQMTGDKAGAEAAMKQYAMVSSGN